MSELLLALAIICTKTNDLNLTYGYTTRVKRECVADLLECIGKNTTKQDWIKCLRNMKKEENQ